MGEQEPRKAKRQLSVKWGNACFMDGDNGHHIQTQEDVKNGIGIGLEAVKANRKSPWQEFYTLAPMEGSQVYGRFDRADAAQLTAFMDEVERRLKKREREQRRNDAK